MKRIKHVMGSMASVANSRALTKQEREVAQGLVLTLKDLARADKVKPRCGHRC